MKTELTYEQQMEIRRRWSERTTLKSLAIEFNTTPARIGHITRTTDPRIKYDRRKPRQINAAA